jgi:hypothetical protein
MNKFRITVVLLLFILTISSITNLLVTDVLAQSSGYNIEFSTYLGGSGFDSIRDVAVDNSGNIYVTGGTESIDFPTTVGPSFNTGSCPTLGTAGQRDVFITKYSPSGQMIWSRLLGGPCYDRAYAIEVDVNQNVYVGGRAGDGFPVTPNAFHTQFMGGETTSHYGYQDAFVAKVSPDGQQVLFATYFGGSDNDIFRDIDVTSTGEVYGVGNQGATYNGSYTQYVQGKFLNGRSGGTDMYIVKISSDGSELLWARHIAGSDSDGYGPAVRVDNNDYPHVYMGTRSDNMPIKNAYQSSRAGEIDSFIAKVEKDGSGLIYGTYLGGSEEEGGETHNLAVDDSGQAIISQGTLSPDYPVIPGAFQDQYAGAFSGGWRVEGDLAVSKLSADGSQLLYSTFVGGDSSDAGEGVSIDSLGNVYATGYTNSSNFPTTSNAFQQITNGGLEAFAVVLNSDFSDLKYSTLMGTPDNDAFRTSVIDSNNNLIVAGSTPSNSWPLVNAYQSTPGGAGDTVVVKFNPTTGPIPTNTPIPTPTSLPPTSTPTPTSQPPTPTPTPTCTSPPGDGNRDCAVNGTDYVIWLVNYGLTGNIGPSQGDYFDDDQVNGVDYVVWLTNYTG